DRLKAALADFKGISVRESDAVSYLDSLGVSAQQHVDPTLAVDANSWDHFSATARASDPYLLVYQLNANPQLETAAKAISKALGVPIRRIEYWKNLRGLGTDRRILPSVQEFVPSFRDATFVITDSFHGAAFST